MKDVFPEAANLLYGYVVSRRILLQSLMIALRRDTLSMVVTKLRRGLPAELVEVIVEMIIQEERNNQDSPYFKLMFSATALDCPTGRSPIERYDFMAEPPRFQVASWNKIRSLRERMLRKLDLLKSHGITWSEFKYVSPLQPAVGIEDIARNLYEHDAIFIYSLQVRSEPHQSRSIAEKESTLNKRLHPIPQPYIYLSFDYLKSSSATLSTTPRHDQPLVAQLVDSVPQPVLELAAACWEEPEVVQLGRQLGGFGSLGNFYRLGSCKSPQFIVLGRRHWIGWNAQKTTKVDCSDDRGVQGI